MLTMSRALRCRVRRKSARGAESWKAIAGFLGMALNANTAINVMEFRSMIPRFSLSTCSLQGETEYPHAVSRPKIHNPAQQENQWSRHQSPMSLRLNKFYNHLVSTVHVISDFILIHDIKFGGKFTPRSR